MPQNETISDQKKVFEVNIVVFKGSLKEKYWERFV